MKVCEQKVSVMVHGREKTFTEQELIAILEKHFSKEVTQKVAQVPTEGYWFEVKPQDIDQNLFQYERGDAKQEETRQLILEAFEEVKNNPEKYGKNFKTMIPKKGWLTETVEDLMSWARDLGNRNADWVEQALEWAQRICNGEPWEAVCNNADTVDWYRLVIWKGGCAQLVGGSCIYQKCPNSPATVICGDWNSDCEIILAVPLVVLYE